MTDQKPQEGDKKTPPINPPPVPVHQGDAEGQQHPVEPKVEAPTSDSSTQKNQADGRESRKNIEQWNRNHRQTMYGIVINSILVGITGISIWFGYRSLKITQDALLVSQKQFESANQPYLQIASVRDSLRPNRPPLVNYTIDNLVSQPAKIVMGKIGIEIMQPDSAHLSPWMLYKSQKKIENYPRIEQYAIKESPYSDTWTADNYITENEFHFIESGVYHVFFYGDILYVSLVTRHELRYHFRVELLAGQRKQFQIWENDNQKISDTVRNLGELLGDFSPKP
ncbi:hypothetical protein [Puia dinghuensis]|nr:hypothetical protein [Puia dinghuensis]